VSDTPDTPDRLLQAALEVFAAKGYEGASTREICRLAEVNVAAIHYYFGDKASLYREVFRVPEQLGIAPVEMTSPGVPLRTALVAFYRHIMAYIAAPKQVQQLRLIFLREELQPSGVLTGQVDAPRRLHDHLTTFLCRAVGADSIDTAINHLAFSIGGLSLVLFVQRTHVDAIAPELLADDAAVEATIQRLADHGTAMVEAERVRRTNAGGARGAATPAAHRPDGRETAAMDTKTSEQRGAPRRRAMERS
jgi:TetR/AcrR family transcriptional regulator, regulator of cefoperazone and chloramphenicol sensitivity